MQFKETSRVAVLGLLIGMGCGGSGSTGESTITDVSGTVGLSISETSSSPSSGPGTSESGPGTSESGPGTSESGPGTSESGSQTSEDLDSTGGDVIGDACMAYLSCLLESCPECYASALPLYGARAPCWDTPEQSASCDQACEALIAERQRECECEGTECIGCIVLESRYTPASEQYDCGLGLVFVDVEYEDGRDVVIELNHSNLDSLELRGTQPCASEPFDVAYEGGSYRFAATLSPADDGGTIALEVSATIGDTSCSLVTELRPD